MVLFFHGFQYRIVNWFHVRNILIILGFYCIQIANAQILNIDREVEDSMKKPWYLLISGSFSKDKQKVDINDLSTYSEYVYKLKSNNAFTFIGQIDATVSGKQVLQNEGFFQVKHRDLDKRLNSFEYYLQYQWNGAWGMVSRKLVGVNFRRRILEKNGLDLYSGIGLFYQFEKWNFNGVTDTNLIPRGYDMVQESDIRTNFYIKGGLKLFKNCDFVTQTYFQSNMVDFLSNNQVRVYISSMLKYNINTNFQLGFNFDLTYNRNPPVPINSTYYGYLMNLGFKF
jgi:hypothetical protein